MFAGINKIDSYTSLGFAEKWADVATIYDLVEEYKKVEFVHERRDIKERQKFISEVRSKKRGVLFASDLAPTGLNFPKICTL